MASNLESFRYWRDKLKKNPRSNRVLRFYLVAKGRLGRFDKRMLAYYGVPFVDYGPIKGVIARAYGAGLVPTATTNGSHATNSLHFRKRAVDLGVRSDEVGTSRQREKLVAFQWAEYARAMRGEEKQGYYELIGPDNERVILRGVRSPLAEGSSLENAHDNHVHVGIL